MNDSQSETYIKGNVYDAFQSIRSWGLTEMMNGLALIIMRCDKKVVKVRTQKDMQHKHNFNGKLSLSQMLSKDDALKT